MKQNFCGLDFGTSNSTIGIWQNGKPYLTPVEGQKTTIPSAIFFGFEEGTTSFGRRAVYEYIDGAEGRLMRALKSVLGTSLIHETTRIGRKSVAFQDIIGMYIAHLKEKAQNYLNGEIDHAVIGRPVFFVDGNPKADQEAQNSLERIARCQGFRHISFQYEPVAAALDYEHTITDEELALIIDIGGGTADFSVVKVSPEGRKKSDRFQDVLSNFGVHIGGTDFDRALSMEAVMPHLGFNSMYRDVFGDKDLTVPSAIFYNLATWHKINLLYTMKVLNQVKDTRRTAIQKNLFDRLIHILETHKGHHLAIEVEKAKIRLVKEPQTQIDMAFADQSLMPLVTQEDMNSALVEHVSRLKQALSQTLADAQVKGNAIDTVFLTGGSTAIPLIKEELLSVVPSAHVIEGDRFGSIGTGLTLDAKRKYGQYNLSQQ